MKALIAGASGLVGSQLLNLLLDSNDFESVVSLVRIPSGIQHSKLIEKVVDFSKIDRKDIGGDVVFCCLGTTMKKAGSKKAFREVDFDIPLELGMKSSVNNIEQFNIISAMGANASSFIFYNKVKGEIEKALGRLKFPILNIYRPSLLVGDRAEARAGEEMAIKFAPIIDTILVGPFKKYRSIEGKTVAKAMLEQSLSAQKGINILSSDQIQKLGES